MFHATLLAALLVAFGVRADAPKADLSDLKDAVRAADKRGANVEPVKAALAALEKALAKGATEAAPPELAALRDAVEVAFKKGESLEAVSDALGAVERALTGKAFERPKGIAQALPTEPSFPKKGRARVPVPRPEPNRGPLGITTVAVTPFSSFRLGIEPTYGLAVKGLTEGSPADKAGLKVNDVLLKLDGKPPGTTPTAFRRLVSELEPNRKFDIVVMRNGETVTVTVPGLDLPLDQPPAPRPANGAKP